MQKKNIKFYAHEMPKLSKNKQEQRLPLQNQLKTIFFSCKKHVACHADIVARRITLLFSDK